MRAATGGTLSDRRRVREAGPLRRFGRNGERIATVFRIRDTECDLNVARSIGQRACRTLGRTYSAQKLATMDRFDKFTDRARKVLTLAQDEAQRFNHNYIGTEHLLLGLVREGEGVAARVLENMNVELSKVRTAVEFIIGRGDRPVVGEVGLTPRAKRVIELAIDEARRLGHNYIGTEHLLLGLVREG